MRIYNTLSKKIEEFEPIRTPLVKIYTCGPTVHDYMHIGNIKTFLMSDILIRTLKLGGYKVKAVQNITDIEDKIIQKAAKQHISIDDLTREYTRFFFEDLRKLNILPANYYPMATQYINKIILYILSLVDKSLAYIEEDGSVYFDISKFPEYGKLSRLKGRILKTGTRTLSDEYTKDNIQDFALWKAVGPDEVGYDSPWGRGRPGWHIECSVMSQDKLGDTFDVHIGGVDLIFPHHENEIAQSEGKTGKPFVKYFIHGEHLLSEGKKMSKSAGNFFTLRDVEKRGYEPLAFRYLVLTSRYRDKLNFTWDSLRAAQNALCNLRRITRDWGEPTIVNDRYWKRFMAALNNDLDTPQALAIMWEMVKSDIPSSEKSETLLKMNQVLGLSLKKYVAKPLEITKEVKELLKERELARKDNDYGKADIIRNKLRDLGFEVEDAEQGTKIRAAK